MPGIANTEVLYCYRCGKHVKREAGKCWYCSAPTRRTIRPPRRCPFCDEEIGAKAIKCPHCGEFLDGRPSTSNSGAVQQVFFLIDKAIIQGNQPMMLQGGAAVPPEVARRLSAQSLQAIQSNNPGLLDQPGIKALPQPAGAMAEASPVDECQNLLPLEPKSGGGSDLVRSSSSVPAIPARSEETPIEERSLTAFQSAGRSLVRAGEYAIGRLLGTGRKRDLLQPQDGEIYEESRYAECPSCHTELLSSDNYCFHCGMLQRSESVEKRTLPRRSGRPVGGILLISALLIGILIWGGERLDAVSSYRFGTYLKPSMAILSLLLLISAFFRNRKSLSQILVLALLVAWIAAAILAFWA